MKTTAYPRHSVYAALLFLISFVFNNCTKSHPPTGSQPAQGSLQSGDGNCLPGTVHGTWVAGVTPSGDTNYVDIGVNVSRAGHYRIVSDAVNGVTFSDSGSFTSTGVQNVRLKPSGTFTSIGVAAFTITFDSSTCGFAVDVKSTPLPDNTWRGTFGGRTYYGSAKVTAIGFGGDNAFDLNGVYAAGSDTTLSFRVRMPLRSDGFFVTLGTYSSSSPGNYFYLQAKGVPFLSAQGTGAATVTIAVTSAFWYPNGADMYEGSFSGTCLDANGNLVQVKDGVFRAGEE
ncbi:MAG TPA: hypothetical protein VIM64_15865 [Puia sp.]